MARIRFLAVLYRQYEFASSRINAIASKLRAWFASFTRPAAARCSEAE